MKVLFIIDYYTFFTLIKLKKYKKFRLKLHRTMFVCVYVMLGFYVSNQAKFTPNQLVKDDKTKELKWGKYNLSSNNRKLLSNINLKLSNILFYYLT